MPSTKNKEKNLSRRMRGMFTAELGNTGLRRFDGQVNREFLPRLHGTKGVQIYSEMGRNDPIVGAILHSVVQTIRNINWQSSTTDDSPEAREAQDFLSEAFNDMSHTFGDFITEAMTMVQYGWSYFEKVYKIRKGHSDDPISHSKYSDGKIAFRKLAIRSQETLDRWKFDNAGGINGLWQQDFVSDSDKAGQSIYLPIEKSLLFRTTSQLNDPEGMSALRTAYRPWYIKKNLEEIMVIGAERELVGLPVIQPPPGFDILNPKNDAIRQEAINILINVRRDEQEGVLVPPDWTLSLLAGTGKREFNLLEMLSYYDKRIAISALAQFILLGLDRVGSYALASEERDLFEIAQKGWLTSVTEVINRFAVDDLLYLNGWDELDDPPQMVPGRLKEPNLEELSNYVVRMVKAGLLYPDLELENLLRKFGGLTIVPPRDAMVESSRKGLDSSHTELPAAMREQFRVVNGSGNGVSKPSSASNSPNGNTDSGKKNKTNGKKTSSVPGVSQENSAPFAIGIADKIYETRIGTVQEAKRRLYDYLQKNPNHYGFIACESGVDERGKVRFDRLTDFVPTQEIAKNSEVFVDWCKARIGNAVAGLEREVDSDFLNGKNGSTGDYHAN